METRFNYIEKIEHKSVGWFGLDFCISDEEREGRTFMIQYDSGTKKFTIPDSDEHCWGEVEDQDYAHQHYSASEIAKLLVLPTKLTA